MYRVSHDGGSTWRLLRCWEVLQVLTCTFPLSVGVLWQTLITEGELVLGAGGSIYRCVIKR